jgi:hypothetical protein
LPQARFVESLSASPPTKPRMCAANPLDLSPWRSSILSARLRSQIPFHGEVTAVNISFLDLNHETNEHSNFSPLRLSGRFCSEPLSDRSFHKTSDQSRRGRSDKSSAQGKSACDDRMSAPFPIGEWSAEAMRWRESSHIAFSGHFDRRDVEPLLRSNGRSLSVFKRRPISTLEMWSQTTGIPSSHPHPAR